MGSRDSLWWDILPADRRAVLHRTDDLPSTADLVVVGGGIVGVAIAFHAQRAGVGRVTLLEADCLGAGASGGAAGLLVPESHSETYQEQFVELGRRSLDCWREWDQMLQSGLGLVDIEWLALQPHPPGWLAPPDAEVLSAEQVAELVPGLASPPPGVLVRHQGWVDPVWALAGLASGIDSVVTRSPVTGFAGQAAGIEITTGHGRISAGAVAFATGGPPAVTGLSMDIPAGWTRGHILVTAPTNQSMPASVAPVANRLPDGRLLVGGSLDDDDADEIDPAIVDTMRQWLHDCIPATATADITHTWCCFRPTHPDHLPVIDLVPGLDAAWFTSGHYRTGILMAPATAEAIISWMQSGRRPAHLAELSASRFQT